jgi:hypothetical protein
MDSGITKPPNTWLLEPGAKKAVVGGATARAHTPTHTHALFFPLFLLSKKQPGRLSTASPACPTRPRRISGFQPPCAHTHRDGRPLGGGRRRALVGFKPARSTSDPSDPSRRPVGGSGRGRRGTRAQMHCMPEFRGQMQPNDAGRSLVRASCGESWPNGRFGGSVDPFTRLRQPRGPCAPRRLFPDPLFAPFILYSVTGEGLSPGAGRGGL